MMGSPLSLKHCSSPASPPTNSQPLPDNILKKNTKLVLGSIKFQVFISCLTLYSLFADDVRTAAFGKDSDFGFDIMNMLLICIFFTQIVVSCIVLDGYFFSFFFFLDVLSTFSIIFDISMINSVIFDSSYSASKNLSQIANQSKASRAATRAVRIVKLFRIIRIIKLYKAARKAAEIKEEGRRLQILKEKLLRKQKIRIENNEQKNKIEEIPKESLPVQIKLNEQSGQQLRSKAEEENTEEFQNSADISQDSLQQFMKKESKIGKILSDLTVKKIIVVVLLIMFIVPLFNSESYISTLNAWDYTTTNAVSLLQTPSIGVDAINKFLNLTLTSFVDKDNPLVQFSTPFNELPSFDAGVVNFLRIMDLSSSTASISLAQYNQIMLQNPTLTLQPGVTVSSGLQITAIINQYSLNQMQAIFSICKTLFVCIVLLLLLQIFANDIDTFIVEPIEGMMQKLLNMAKDPESASKEELNSNAQLQTAVISNAIIKIGALLSIVFGSAGAEIIGTNIIDEGDMNPMIEGRKKCAIFGFCDIRHFTEVTEVLQEQILIFVNKIGSLVHESVYRYGGSANKNIGEAFLLVWKIPDGKYSLNMQTNEVNWLDPQYLSVLADFAVFGFIKTLIKINKDPLILEYRKDPKLNAAIKNFSVDMGFGLHIGWAIEGAIGSEFKIDASYLSPNVNMASRLEAATKQFGVDFLISEDLYDVLTTQMKRYCRNIDRVTVKGSQKPLRLYTVDMNYEAITPPMNKALKYPTPTDIPDSEAKRALNLEYLKEEQLANYNADIFIKNKKEFREVLVDCLSSEFRGRFELGVESYLKGKWSDSHLHLCEALKLRRTDGPTKCLLNYMKKFNFVAPGDWKNYRSLTSK